MLHPRTCHRTSIQQVRLAGDFGAGSAVYRATGTADPAAVNHSSPVGQANRGTGEPIESELEKFQQASRFRSFLSAASGAEIERNQAPSWRPEGAPRASATTSGSDRDPARRAGPMCLRLCEVPAGLTEDLLYPSVDRVARDSDASHACGAQESPMRRLSALGEGEDSSNVSIW